VHSFLALFGTKERKTQEAWESQELEGRMNEGNTGMKNTAKLQEAVFGTGMKR
jgi:hypothetical protein